MDQEAVVFACWSRRGCWRLALTCRRRWRLIRDAIRLRHEHPTLEPDVYARRRGQMQKRLDLLIGRGWTNKETLRLVKRLRRHRNEP